MATGLSRRDFLRRLATVSAAGLVSSACGSRPTPSGTLPTAPTATSLPQASPFPTTPAPSASAPTRLLPTATPLTASPAATLSVNATTITPATGSAYLAVARGAGTDPAELVRRALAAIGGMERFVKSGANVIIKPNVCNAYHGPEYASTTNPDVVAVLVTLCLAAGAKRVRVMDLPFGGTAQAAYATSGIEAAVKAAGGRTETMSQMKFREIAIPQGRTIRKWQVYGDILDADLVINVPIAKTHGSARLTLGMKNLMGVIEDRGAFHARGLHQCIADLASAVKPQLTVVDAVRGLMANGPTGGNLDDVKRMDTIIASADVVAADAYATTLFGLAGKDVGYIRAAAEMGLGQMDLGAIKVEEIVVS